MTETKIILIKKSLTIIAAMIVGFLMPYLSRIPLAFKYGTPWIWKYMNDSDDVLRWNGLHSLSLAAIVLFGVIYIFTKLKWQFYGSVFAHYAVTALVYYNFMEKYGSDDFLGCIFFPPFFAFISVGGGLLGLGVELVINNRTNSRKNIPAFSDDFR